MHKGIFLAAAVLASSFWGQFWPWASAPVVVSVDPLAAYRVATGSVDVYSTDRKIVGIQNSIYTSINTALVYRQAPQIHPPAYAQTLGNGVLVKSLSVQSGLPGVNVNVVALNLQTSSANSVYFEASSTGQVFVVKNLKPSAGGILSFTLPSFPVGRYDVAISNSSGMSNTAFFVVRAPTSPKVTVISVLPAKVRWGGTLVISGSGFTATGNEVITAFDTIFNVPSPDGRTLVVHITPEQMRVAASMGSGAISIPDTIEVVNNNGYTPAAKNFSVSI